LSSALRHKAAFLHHRYDVGQIDVRADLQVRPKAFANNLSSPLTASEHPKQVGSIVRKKLVGCLRGIGAFNRTIPNTENAIDQHPPAHNVFQAETAVSACTRNEDVESGGCKPVRGSGYIQERAGDDCLSL
jgi:hypothetical protein